MFGSDQQLQKKPKALCRKLQGNTTFNEALIPGSCSSHDLQMLLFFFSMVKLIEN